MTAKEKARELVLKFAFKGAQHEGEAKTFALIAVDEIIENLCYVSTGIKPTIYDYWQEVKQELELL